MFLICIILIYIDNIDLINKSDLLLVMGFPNDLQDAVILCCDSREL